VQSELPEPAVLIAGVAGPQHVGRDSEAGTQSPQAKPSPAEEKETVNSPTLDSPTTDGMNIDEPEKMQNLKESIRVWSEEQSDDCSKQFGNGFLAKKEYCIQKTGPKNVTNLDQ